MIHVQSSSNPVFVELPGDLAPAKVGRSARGECPGRQVFPDINLLTLCQPCRMNTHPAQHAGGTDAALPLLVGNTGLPALLPAGPGIAPRSIRALGNKR